MPQPTTVRNGGHRLGPITRAENGTRNVIRAALQLQLALIVGRAPTGCRRKSPANACAVAVPTARRGDRAQRRADHAEQMAAPGVG